MAFRLSGIGITSINTAGLRAPTGIRNKVTGLKRVFARLNSRCHTRGNSASTTVHFTAGVCTSPRANTFANNATVGFNYLMNCGSGVLRGGGTSRVGLTSKA